MPLRWGLVTAAKICNDFVNAINSYPGKSDQVIVAVASRSKDNAEKFAKLHGIKLVFDTYQAMAVSKDIDIAYIGALNPDHYNLARLFLENGKHVLCEKPLCLNSKQAKSLIDLARRNKLFLMEAIWSRFAPTYQELQKDVEAGKIGDVAFLEANFGLTIDTVERLKKKDLGGGTVLDLGVYVIQLAQFIFKDEPTKVTATGELNEEGVDEVATVILEYTGGRRAVLNIHSRVRLWNKATVYGSKGRATLSDPFHFPTELVRVDGKVDTFPLHSSDKPYNFGNSAGLVYEALEVKRCIEAGLIESPRMTHEDSLILARIEDEVRKQLGVHYDVDDKVYP